MQRRQLPIEHRACTPAVERRGRRFVLPDLFPTHSVLEAKMRNRPRPVRDAADQVGALAFEGRELLADVRERWDDLTSDCYRYRIRVEE